MSRVSRLWPTAAVWPTAAFVALASCHRGAQTENTPAATPNPQMPLLAAFAPQAIVLAPTARVAFSATDSLIREAGSARAAGRSFDDELATRLRERGLASGWILPADLVRAYERNSTYAQDPYNLAIDPLRVPRFVAGSKYGEPLSTQLRTMIALHADARFVLLPVDLRLHQGGRTTLRLALVDPRKAESIWVGQVVSDSGAAQSRAGLTQVARRVADLFAAP